MAADPVFFTTPRIERGVISAANTNRDGTGTVVQFAVGVANGTKVNEIVVKARGTTTAGMVRVFLYNGSTYSLLDEYAVSAITAAANTATFRVSTAYNNLFLASASWTLVASTHNAESFDVMAFLGDA